MGSVASKVFILGEYAVLKGVPALVAAIGPRFELESETGSPDAYPAQSPAGRLLNGERAAWRIRDPFAGAGGFGASTAQFALAYAALASEKGWSGDWLSVWKKYRALLRREPSHLTPSGADLVAQILGGVQAFRIERNGDGASAVDLTRAPDWSSFMVFSATGQTGRKVATHRHLDALNGAKLDEVTDRLRAPIEAGIAAAKGSDLAGLSRAMSDSSEILRLCGLEAPETTDDCRAFRALPEVLAAKGAGAMQADAVVVAVDPAVRDRSAILKLASERGLRVVAEAIRPEPGMQLGEEARR